MALADDIINQINQSLTTNLSWLTNAYGAVQRLQRIDSDGKKVYYPGFYTGVGKEYLNMLPDGTLGNYCYFDIDETDYQNLNRNIRTSFKFKIVFWFNWITLYGDSEQRSIEEVKAQVLNVLTATPYTKMVESFRCYEDADEIYKGYDHKEIKSQFLMREYGGFSIEGEIFGLFACNLSLPTPTIPFNVVGAIPFDHSFTEKAWPYEKWFTSTIWCRTWFWAAGNDDLNLISGLPDSYNIIKTSLKTSLSVNDNTGGSELIKSGGNYNLFLSSELVTIYLTVWYVK